MGPQSWQNINAESGNDLKKTSIPYGKWTSGSV